MDEILGVRVPEHREERNEICHELTIKYSLAYMKRKTPFSLDSKEFADHLKTCTQTNKAPGMIATFWANGWLFHSMIVGVDDHNWIGSNNLNTFQKGGDRVSIDVSKMLSGDDKILLSIAGVPDSHLYDLKYYKPEDVARYVQETDPEPGCCC